MATTGRPRGLRVRTPCTTEDEFIALYQRDCDDSSLFTATDNLIAEGADVAFSLELAGGQPMLRGLGVVLNAWPTADNRFGRAGVHIALVQLTTASEPIHGRLLEARATADSPPRQRTPGNTQVHFGVIATPSALPRWPDEDSVIGDVRRSITREFEVADPNQMDTQTMPEPSAGAPLTLIEDRASHTTRYEGPLRAPARPAIAMPDSPGVRAQPVALESSGPTRLPLIAREASGITPLPPSPAPITGDASGVAPLPPIARDASGPAPLPPTPLSREKSEPTRLPPSPAPSSARDSSNATPLPPTPAPPPPGPLPPRLPPIPTSASPKPASPSSMRAATPSPVPAIATPPRSARITATRLPAIAVAEPVLAASAPHSVAAIAESHAQDTPSDEPHGFAHQLSRASARLTWAYEWIGSHVADAYRRLWTWLRPHALTFWRSRARMPAVFAAGILVGVLVSSMMRSTPGPRPSAALAQNEHAVTPTVAPAQCAATEPAKLDAAGVIAEAPAKSTHVADAPAQPTKPPRVALAAPPTKPPRIALAAATPTKPPRVAATKVAAPPATKPRVAPTKLATSAPKPSVAPVKPSAMRPTKPAPVTTAHVAAVKQPATKPALTVATKPPAVAPKPTSARPTTAGKPAAIAKPSTTITTKTAATKPAPTTATKPAPIKPAPKPAKPTGKARCTSLDCI